MSAMYLQNKYTRWYYQIINNAKLRQPTGYTEKHHIIPRSLGGSNNKDNLVALTAREHFVCHLMLTRMTTNEAKKKMISAVFYLSGRGGRAERNNKIKSSRIYETLRTALSRIVSQQHKGRKRPQRSNDYLTKQSVSKQGSKNPNSIGYFITPWGTFESSRLASKSCPSKMSAPCVANFCIKNNQKPITFLSVCRSKGYLTKECVGKTPFDLGFSFNNYIR